MYERTTEGDKSPRSWKDLAKGDPSKWSQEWRDLRSEFDVTMLQAAAILFGMDPLLLREKLSDDFDGLLETNLGKDLWELHRSNFDASYPDDAWSAYSEYITHLRFAVCCGNSDEFCVESDELLEQQVAYHDREHIY